MWFKFQLNPVGCLWYGHNGIMRVCCNRTQRIIMHGLHFWRDNIKAWGDQLPNYQTPDKEIFKTPFNMNQWRETRTEFMTSISLLETCLRLWVHHGTYSQMLPGPSVPYNLTIRHCHTCEPQWIWTWWAHHNDVMRKHQGLLYCIT